jgi:hypothetical protein
MESPPWNAELLDYLAVHLADEGYDLKATIRLICSSQTYQARTPALQDPPDAAEYVFRGPLARRMTAEQFLDAIWQITAAGPAQPDAEVMRVRSQADGTSEGRDHHSLADLIGRWIWSYPEASGAVPAAGETITLRRRFELASVPPHAVAAVTCDNQYTLYVNGTRVQSGDDWEKVDAVPLADHLRVGANEILIVARNAGSGPNPAGLFFEARLQGPDQPGKTIGSDASWQWTASTPDAEGRFETPPDDWQSAAIAANQAVWSRVQGQLVARLAQPPDASPPLVRASLMNNDALMTALGRPTRDQIISMRPSELTTLEAIHLSNGQELADFIARGARRLATGDWIQQNGGPREETAVGQLVPWIFRFALARAPTEQELALTCEMVGEEPRVEQIEDLLWAVFMLPEFQLIR